MGSWPRSSPHLVAVQAACQVTARRRHSRYGHLQAEACAPAAQRTLAVPPGKSARSGMLHVRCGHLFQWAALLSTRWQDSERVWVPGGNSGSGSGIQTHLPWLQAGEQLYARPPCARAQDQQGPNDQEEGPKPFWPTQGLAHQSEMLPIDRRQPHDTRCRGKREVVILSGGGAACEALALH